jgi:hypothetical protein
MAAGWPVKANYATGDILSATNMNDLSGTVNYIDPTSATDGQVLTRDNASSGKVKWASVPSGSMTLLASGNLTSTGVTISAISGAYKNLVGWIKNPYLNVGDDLAMRVNGDTANRYNWVIDNTTTTLRQAAMTDHVRFVGSTNTPTTSVGAFASFVILDYADTTHVKQITTTYADPSQTISAMGSGQYNQTTAITSVFVGTDGGTSTFSGGTYEIYGVK